MKLIAAALVVCSLAAGCQNHGAKDQSATSAEATDGQPPASGMRQHAVALDQFVKLHAGIKRAEVERLLGKHGEHQFTYTDDDGGVWHNVVYTVAQEARYASTALHLLYKDGALHSIIDYMDEWNHHKALRGLRPDEFEDRDKRKQRPIAAFNDDKPMRELFRVKALRGDDIAKTMPDLKKRILDAERKHKARDKANPPDPGLWVISKIFSTPAERAKMKRAYEANAEFMTKFDGGLVNIGMTEAQVHKLFGEPLYRANLNDSERVGIYGPKDTRAIAAVQHYLACAPVAVLYRKNAVVRVLSNWYFDTDWRDKVWPELKSPERGSRD